LGLKCAGTWMRCGPIDLAAVFEPGVEPAIEHRAAAMPDRVEEPNAARGERAAEVFDEDDGLSAIQSNAPGCFTCGVRETGDRFRRGEGEPNLIDIDLGCAGNASGPVVIEGASVNDYDTRLAKIGAKPGDINNGTRM